MSDVDFYEISKNQVGSELYEHVYTAALDSLNSYGVNELGAYKDITDTNWQLDSLICFNKTNNKCIMAFTVQYEKDVSNGVNYFYGVNIKGEWYFFRGPHIFIPTKDHTPIPFPQLHKIAMKEVFRGYLKKNKAGEWEINERFFGDIDRILAIHKGKFETEEEWERWWTKSVIEANWSRRDTSSETLP